MKAEFWKGATPGDYSRVCGKPCALGGQHTAPGWNGMVYCEHGLSDYACDRCQGRPDTYDPMCDCGRKKDDHTEAEASLCIGRQIAFATTENVHVVGP